MNKKLLIFSLHDHVDIIMQFKNIIHEITIDDQSNFYLQYYNHRIFLTYDFFYNTVEKLKILLDVALHNNLQLPIDQNKDLGILWNELCNQHKFSELSFIHDNYDFVYNYLILNSTFVYNDKEGNIIFNVTKLYPFTNARKKRKRSYNYFLGWMESYKPIYKTIISPELAQTWLLQIQEILEIIDKNTESINNL